MKRKSGVERKRREKQEWKKGGKKRSPLRPHIMRVNTAFRRHAPLVPPAFPFLFPTQSEEGRVPLNLEGVHSPADKLAGRLARARGRTMNSLSSERDRYDRYKSKRGRDGICLMLRVARVAVHHNSHSVDK